MSTMKNSLHDEIKSLQQKEQEQKALKNYKRNRIGIVASAILLLVILWLMITGLSSANSLAMLVLFISVLGLFYFRREMMALRQGVLFSGAVFIFVGGLIAILYVAAQMIMFDGMDKMDWLLTLILIFGPLIRHISSILKARRGE